MSFHEKSSAAMLVLLAAIYGSYFHGVFGAFGTPRSLDDAGGTLLTMVILLVALGVIAHIVIAVLSPKEEAEGEADERDRLIETRSEARASYMTSAGVLFVLVLAFNEVGSYWIAHALLATLVLSEMAKQGFRLAAYRFGW